MEYSLESREDAVIVAVRGRVDESSCEQFGEGLSQAITLAGEAELTQVIIDLTDLDYMSSRGLRALTVARAEGEDSGVALSLASPNETMRDILAISRYDQLFTIRNSIESGR